ncbi:hypothetical protein A9310_22450 [Gordonia sp. UCD-TK1]|nr:hypothetical protein A9310_22450 [Gordonia sp. UCD-TK1]
MLRAGTDETDVADALQLWLTKPNVGPGILPSLVSDVIKARRPTAVVAKPSKLRGIAQLAAQARAEEQTHTRREIAQ